MGKKQKISFESHYSNLFGERWDLLKESLLDSNSQYVELKEGFLQSYFLDPASVEAALVLDVQEGFQVLDLCAAHGGKSLILANALNGKGWLVSNDLSPARRERLNRVLKGQFKVVTSLYRRELGDSTEFGVHILPDQCNGVDPIYYSIIEKVAPSHLNS